MHHLVVGRMLVVVVHVVFDCLPVFVQPVVEDGNSGDCNGQRTDDDHKHFDVSDLDQQNVLDSHCAQSQNDHGYQYLDGDRLHQVEFSNHGQCGHKGRHAEQTHGCDAGQEHHRVLSLHQAYQRETDCKQTQVQHCLPTHFTQQNHETKNKANQAKKVLDSQNSVEKVFRIVCTH